MKGKATLYFYDKNNKLINKEIHKNMITDAVNNLVNQNYVVNAITNNGGDVANTYSPIWKNFAGLLLFTNEVDSSVIIPDKNTISNFTGNGTDATHFDSTNVYDGVFDSSESVFKPEYLKLVYEFPLGSVSGTIGSLALTSIQGGNNGLAKGNESIFLSYTDKNLQNGSACGVGIDTPSANFIPYVNIQEDGMPIGINKDGLFVCFDGTNIKYYQTKLKVNFTDTFYKMQSISDFNTIYGGTLDNIPLLELKKEITLDNVIANVDKAVLIGSDIYVPTLSGSTFVLYKIHANNDDADVDTCTTTLSGISNITDYRCTNDKLYITTDDYLYIVNGVDYDNSTHELTFDRIELAESGLTPLVFKDTVALLNVSNITNNSTRYIYFLTNSNVLNKNTIKFAGSCDKIINFSFNFAEPVFGIITKTGNVATINTNVFTSYLATINNISPAIKYSTVVMKVVYELFSEDYEE